ncbi:hypothetical protein BRARA_B01653 [Brassica rapa]|uniref:Uncharacterized protein n=1 Tax=Brassica campestris TaxID=3711 RepID=A0A398AFZ0_BRACM|nr:hypothetical protein BRARA_B01653 [Brassica rapa]
MDESENCNHKGYLVAQCEPTISLALQVRFLIKIKILLLQINKTTIELVWETEKVRRKLKMNKMISPRDKHKLRDKHSTKKLLEHQGTIN